jgi:hypothetical protein
MKKSEKKLPSESERRAAHTERVVRHVLQLTAENQKLRQKVKQLRIIRDTMAVYVDALRKQIDKLVADSEKATIPLENLPPEATFFQVAQIANEMGLRMDVEKSSLVQDAPEGEPAIRFDNRKES